MWEYKSKEERVEVCCSGCNFRKCIRNGQFTFSKCADHQNNKTWIDEDE